MKHCQAPISHVGNLGCAPVQINAVIFLLTTFTLCDCVPNAHYNDVIMGTIASRITSLTIVYSTVYSDADQRKHQSSASPAFVWGIHRGPVNSQHKWPVTRRMFRMQQVDSIDRIPILFGHIMACFQCKHGQTSPLVLLGGIKKSIRYIALKYNTIINTTCEEG